MDLKRHLKKKNEKTALVGIKPGKEFRLDVSPPSVLVWKEGAKFFQVGHAGRESRVGWER